MDDSALRDYRKLITERHPALPHQAGKAFKELVLVLRNKRPSRAGFKAISTRSGPIMIRPTVKPEIDVDTLAKALIQIAKENPEGFLGGDLDLTN